MFSVLKMTFEAQETSGPALAADAGNNLYYQSGWVRGAFPADLSASDPSGVCSLQATVNGRVISSYSDPSPDTTQWTQCHGSAINASVDSTAYPDGAGAIKLGYAATNAAGAVGAASRAVNVDNVTPSVNLTAPADTASTSGTQAVTATGSGGPSGIAAIYCSVDGGTAQTYPGAAAQIPVAGIGSHQIVCYARNHAVNASGVTATSPLATLNLSIRQPTASAITFARIADALRCHTATVVVRVAGRIHTVRRHGKRVRVRGPARRVRRRVRKCHARTVVRTVRVILKRHGKPVLRHGKPVSVKRRVRRVLLPHTVSKPTLRVRHGKATTVNGFVGLADGTALAGQTVDVYSSPNDNAPRFRLMTTATTNSVGRLDGPGPGWPVAADRSRLSRQRHDGAGDLVDGQADGAGEDRDVDIPAGGPVVSEDHHPRPSGRRIRARRRRRPPPPRPVSGRTFPPGAVPDQPARPVQIPMDVRIGARRRDLPIRRGHHGDRIRLSVGSGRQPGHPGDVRTATLIGTPGSIRADFVTKV